MSNKTKGFAKVQKGLTIFIGLFFVLASCQKRPIPHEGHFTQYQPLHLVKGRTIASIAQNDNLNMDPKQVYLSCYLKENKKQQECFELLSTEHQLENDFQKIEEEIIEISKSIVNELTPKILSYIKSQNAFCLKNATLSFEKCLELKKDKDSVEVSNHYQELHPELNGQEYLFLKAKIAERYSELLKDFLDDYKEIKSSEVSQAISEHFHYVDNKLSKELKWIEKEKFLPNCHHYCQKQAKKMLKAFIGNNAYVFLESSSSIEEKCSELLAKEEIMAMINKNTNAALEEEINKLSEKITAITSEKSIQCLLEKRIYNSETIAKKTLDECFNKSWSQESDEVLSAWLNQQEENSFFAKNHRFIFSKVKFPKQQIKRDIASRLESNLAP